MTIRMKVDEDLPTDVATALSAAGNEVQTVIQQGLSGATDEFLWAKIQQEGYCLVTADKGVADARLHPPGTHAGIVLLRLPHESRSGYIRLTQKLLDGLNLESITGAIVVARRPRRSASTGVHDDC